jgi:hypothetical protein
MKINVKYRDLVKLYLWDEYCNKYGIDPYCMKGDYAGDCIAEIEIDEDKSNIVLK